MIWKREKGKKICLKIIMHTKCNADSKCNEDSTPAPTLELDSVLTVQTFPKCERKYPKMDEM